MSATIFLSLMQLSEEGTDAILSAEAARPFYGLIFDRLLAQRILQEQAAISDWEVCDCCDCGLPFRPIRAAGGAFRAECPLDPRRDVVLAPDDLRTFRIGRAEFARSIALAAGFEGAPSEIASGIWHLGAGEAGRAVFLVLARADATQQATVSLIRQAAHPAPATLLGPKLSPRDAMRFADAEIHFVVTSAVLVSAPTDLGVAIDSAKLEPTPLAPSLVLNSATGEVNVRGHKVILSHQLAPVLQRLVEKARSKDPVASGSEVEGHTGREARDLIRELREAFKAAGMPDREVKALIANVRSRGWRIGVEPSEILILD